MLMLPEIVVILTGFVLLVADLFLADRHKPLLTWGALLGLAMALAALLQTPDVGVAFGGRYAVDPLGWWFKLVFLGSALVLVAITADSLVPRGDATRLHNPGEFLAILLWNLSGMLWVSSARDIVMLYVALELATIPLFLLTAWRRDSEGGEAGLKYMVAGATASALLLLGLSLLYGLTGTTDLNAMRTLLAPTEATLFAGALAVAGIGFKLTLVPLHLWAPEVYQGAPTPVTAWLSVASKAAGLAVLMLLMYRVFLPFLPSLGVVVAGVATATMTAGNLVAIVQRNIKRFMAFSAISQAGYLLLGFLGTHDAGATSEGAAAMVYYLLVYAVTNLAVFAVIVRVTDATGRTQITDFRGLSQTNPLLALAMMAGLFGLAGIPPLSGFVGKFFLFSVAAHAGFHWLVGVAAVNSTISLYYYLRVIRQMYMEPPLADDQPVPTTPLFGVAVALTTAGGVLLGVLPSVYEAVRTSAALWGQGLR